MLKKTVFNSTSEVRQQFTKHMLKSSIGDHWFSAYAKFSEKLLFFTPLYADARLCTKGQEMLSFWKILRTY